MSERTCALPGCEVVVTGRRMTCSAAHRQAWNRLKKRTSWEATDLGSAKPEDAADAVAKADPIEIAMRVFEQEITPHVRKAITDDVIKAIGSLVTLTPELVRSLGNDLMSKDPIARGRAQTLVAKYTLGAFDQEKEANSRPLNIYLGNMPVPGEQIPDTIASSDNTVQQCERCEETKTLDHFEPGAPRCNECQAEIRDAITESYK